jgi:hypothetical protein
VSMAVPDESQDAHHVGRALTVAQARLVKSLSRLDLATALETTTAISLDRALVWRHC